MSETAPLEERLQQYESSLKERINRYERSLKRRIEKSDPKCFVIEGKHWIPIYGLYRLGKDIFDIGVREKEVHVPVRTNFLIYYHIFVISMIAIGVGYLGKRSS